MAECTYFHEFAPVCDYPGCGHFFTDDLDRIIHRAVYDDEAHERHKKLIEDLTELARSLAVKKPARKRR